MQGETYSATGVGDPSRVSFLSVQKTDSNSGNTVCTVSSVQVSPVQSNLDFNEGLLRLGLLSQYYSSS